MRRNDLLSSLVFFGFGLLVLLYAPQFNLGTLRRPGSGLIPFLSGAMICLYAAVTFIQAYSQKSGKEQKIWAKVRFRPLIFVLFMLLLFPAAMNLLGFITSSFVLLMLLMRYAGSQTWMTSVFGAGLTSAASYLLFETWLKTQFPTGIIGF